MFSPEVTARHQSLLEAAQGYPLVRHSHDECWTRKDQLADALDKKGQPTRALTDAEQTFILHEQLVCKIDYRYWSERYAIVAKETQDAEPLVPRWKSQDLFLAKLAKLEEGKAQSGDPDGLLLNVLKARQLGLSTETEVIIAHRLTTQTSLRGLVAGDVPEQSKYLFGMAELVVASLPWWLCPPIRAHQTGSYIEVGDEIGASSLRAAAGKSQRGGLQDRGGAKGNIGRGKTYSAAHLSEISTWERPEQIDDGLLPGVPIRPRVFLVRESTAKGRNDYWHNEWRAADAGRGRFTNIFIPWYIEPDKYWLVPPSGWEPSDTSKVHAEMIERTSAQFLLGETIRLPREQLYWYERMRAKFEEDGNLHKFLEEYPAVPEEAFQFAGRSIFNSATLDALRRQERLPVAVLHVEPMKTIAQMKAWEAEQASRAGAGV